MQNFSLLSPFLEPNTACTKCGDTKCRIAPLSLTKIEFIKLEQNMFLHFNTKG